MSDSPFERACAVAGGITKLAALLGRPKQTVNHWRSRVPVEACPQIERETGVTCEELRPDIAWKRTPEGMYWAINEPAKASA